MCKCNHLGINLSLVNEKSLCWWRWGVRFQKLKFVALLLWVTLGADAANVVRTLPGYEGELPFKLETGYVGVGKNEEIQLFFYFVESQRDPVNDPLLLWLTGGPGCSGLTGIVHEIGPFQINYSTYNGSLPSLIPNTYAFTQVASVIFLDAPVGTGFSYSTTKDSFPITDISSVDFNYQFLQKWLSDHPNFLKNSLYITGDSYSGIIIPLLVNKIRKGREAGDEPEINLHGYTLGNPLTTEDDKNMVIPFAHRLSLLSDELYESVRLNCNGNYVHVDANNTACIKDLEVAHMCTDAVYVRHILDPICPFEVTEQVSDAIMVDVFQGKRPWCRDFNHVLLSRWANDTRVQEALHVRNETINEWVVCSSSLAYVKTAYNVVEYHRSFLNTSYRGLVYSGDHDRAVPFIETMSWIRSLNMTVSDSWKPWFVDGQAAGFTKTYKHGNFTLTFATVLGAGHTAPEYKPKPCLKMFERWLAHKDMHGTRFPEPSFSDRRFASV